MGERQSSRGFTTSLALRRLHGADDPDRLARRHQVASDEHGFLCRLLARDPAISASFPRWRALYRLELTRSVARCSVSLLPHWLREPLRNRSLCSFLLFFLLFRFLPSFLRMCMDSLSIVAPASLPRRGWNLSQLPNNSETYLRGFPTLSPLVRVHSRAKGCAVEISSCNEPWRLHNPIAGPELAFETNTLVGGHSGLLGFSAIALP